MQCTSVFTLFMVTLAMVTSQKDCKDNSACSKNQCCVMTSSTMGKCENLLQEGAECDDPEKVSSWVFENQVDKCPCAPGLICKFRGENSAAPRVDEIHRCRSLNPTAVRTKTIPATVPARTVPPATVQAEIVQTPPPEFITEDIIDWEEVTETPNPAEEITIMLEEDSDILTEYLQQE